MIKHLRFFCSEKPYKAMLIATDAHRFEFTSRVFFYFWSAQQTCDYLSQNWILDNLSLLLLHYASSLTKRFVKTENEKCF